MKALIILSIFLFGSSFALRTPEKALSPLHERFITANLNAYIDEILPHVREFIVANGFDPLSLPDIEESFSAKPIIITYHGKLLLSKGFLWNLSTVRRSGDVKVQYMSKIIKVSANFALDQINFYYDYLAKIMNIGPRGGVRGSAKTASVFCEVLIDFNNYEVHLQDFYLYNVGSISVKFTGNILVDWLVNALTSVITTLFKGLILGFVESAMRGAIQDIISDINNSISYTQSFLDELRLMHNTIPAV